MHLFFFLHATHYLVRKDMEELEYIRLHAQKFLENKEESSVDLWVHFV